MHFCSFDLLSFFTHQCFEKHPFEFIENAINVILISQIDLEMFENICLENSNRDIDCYNIIIEIVLFITCNLWWYFPLPCGMTLVKFGSNLLLMTTTQSWPQLLDQMDQPQMIPQFGRYQLKQNSLSQENFLTMTCLWKN